MLKHFVWFKIKSTTDFFMLIFLDRVVHPHEHDATLRGSFTAVEFQASLFSIKKTTRIERFHCAEYHLAWTN
jgi:hypothetical protein